MQLLIKETSYWRREHEKMDREDFNLITGQLNILELKIEEIKNTQTEMNTSLSKIREAVYGPDQGIYARIRDLEIWKTSNSRMNWLIITGMVGIVSFLAQNFISKAF
tara:strand:+ start:1454 stop:1774 length:321 start_codon:yes stop_codon:yes gene_type:complete